MSRHQLVLSNRVVYQPTRGNFGDPMDETEAAKEGFAKRNLKQLSWVRSVPGVGLGLPGFVLASSFPPVGLENGKFIDRTARGIDSTDGDPPKSKMRGSALLGLSTNLPRG